MSSLIGDQITQSTALQNSLQAAVNQLAQLTQGMVAPRPADPERAMKYKALLEEVGATRGRPLFYPYLGTGAGRGAYVELADGSVKLDLINGIGIHLFGHGHPELVRASLRGALSDIVNQGNLQPNEEYGALARKLLGIASRRSRLAHVWFATCGTMANEIALKISRQKNAPARKAIAFSGSFSGRSTMMQELTDNPAFREGQPEYGEVLRLPFYDRKDPRSGETTLRLMCEHVARHEKDISAFVFEPVQGEGGFNVAPREFFLPLFDLCRSKGIAVWADEVQTFSRTGEFFAFETLDIGDYVDIVTVAKTVQVGAALYTKEYNPKPGLIAGTFAGTSAALSAGLAVVDLLEQGGYMGRDGKVARLHNKFTQMLQDLAQGECRGMLSEVRGIGLMVAVTPFDGGKDRVNILLQALFKNGLIAFSCGRGVMGLRFLLPAILTDNDIAVAKQILSQTLQQVAKETGWTS